MVGPPSDMFDRFITVYREHRKSLRPDTVDAILREENEDEVLEWLTVVTRTPSSYKFVRCGEKSVRMVGERLTGKTIDMLPTNRAGHLRRIYDRLLDGGGATENRCVYRFSNGKEAVVHTLMIPAPDQGDAGVVYILSAPNLGNARWLAEIVAGVTDDVSKPRAIVGLNERAVDIN